MQRLCDACNSILYALSCLCRSPCMTSFMLLLRLANPLLLYMQVFFPTRRLPPFGTMCTARGFQITIKKSPGFNRGIFYMALSAVKENAGHQRLPVRAPIKSKGGGADGRCRMQAETKNVRATVCFPLRRCPRRTFAEATCTFVYIMGQAQIELLGSKGFLGVESARNSR